MVGQSVTSQFQVLSDCFHKYAFLRLAKYQHKGVVSKEECFKEAAAFYFTREPFEAALKYLRSLKLIIYYDEILPDVVFVDAQTLLTNPATHQPHVVVNLQLVVEYSSPQSVTGAVREDTSKPHAGVRGVGV